ncbi:Forkhead box protein J3 [Tulasnella sp. 403]|nr:Forkhead box protein J3 [Tulasnella sp. 403]
MHPTQYVQSGIYYHPAGTQPLQPGWNANSFGPSSTLPPIQYVYVQSGQSSVQPSVVLPSPTATGVTTPSTASSPTFSPVVSPSDLKKKTYKAARRSSAARRTSVTRGPDATLDELIDYDADHRPAYSVKSLCEYALRGSGKPRMTLDEICEAIQRRFPFYKEKENARRLRNSVRHDLSYDPRFLNTKRAPDQPGRGDFWEIDPSPKPVKSFMANKRASAVVVPATTPSSSKTSNPALGHPSRGNEYIPTTFVTVPGLNPGSPFVVDSRALPRVKEASPSPSFVGYRSPDPYGFSTYTLR